MKYPPFRLITIIPNLLSLFDKAKNIQITSIKRKIDDKNLSITYTLIFEDKDRFNEYLELDNRIALFLQEGL